MMRVEKFNYDVASTIKNRVTQVAQKVSSYDEVDRVDLSGGKGEVSISSIAMMQQGLKPIFLDSASYIAGANVSFNTETKDINNADVTLCSEDNEERYVVKENGNEKIFREISYSPQEDSYSIITVKTDKQSGEITDYKISFKKEDI
jgi:hypothetical protein